MKLLIVCASLDLTQPFSATPAWWQLLKALYEVGVDVIATPYQGPAIESLWWRAESNPAQWQGDAFKALRDVYRQFGGEKPQVQLEESGRCEGTAAVPRRTAENAIARINWCAALRKRPSRRCGTATWTAF